MDELAKNLKNILYLSENDEDEKNQYTIIYNKNIYKTISGLSKNEIRLKFILNVIETFSVYNKIQDYINEYFYEYFNEYFNKNTDERDKYLAIFDPEYLNAFFLFWLNYFNLEYKNIEIINEHEVKYF